MTHIQENPINPRCHAFEVLASFFLGESQIKLLIPSFHPFSHRFEQSHRTRWNNSFDRYPIHYSTCSFSLPMAHIGCSVHHPQSTLQLLSQTTPRARPKPATSATKKFEEEGCRGIPCRFPSKPCTILSLTYMAIPFIFQILEFLPHCTTCVPSPGDTTSRKRITPNLFRIN